MIATVYLRCECRRQSHSHIPADVHQIDGIHDLPCIRLYDFRFRIEFQIERVVLIYHLIDYLVAIGINCSRYLNALKHRFDHQVIPGDICQLRNRFLILLEILIEQFRYCLFLIPTRGTIRLCDIRIPCGRYALLVQLILAAWQPHIDHSRIIPIGGRFNGEIARFIRC